ncbi:MAG: hypothetical protein SGPRY_003470 [Prymnesium sp.]
MGFFGEPSSLPVRTYEEELSFLSQVSPTRTSIRVGFVPGMRVPATLYISPSLSPLLLSELSQFTSSSSSHGFLPALKQIANVAALPGIVRHSIGLPDLHSGYGFAIGNVAAFDTSDPLAVVSPGGERHQARGSPHATSQVTALSSRLIASRHMSLPPSPRVIKSHHESCVSPRVMRVTTRHACHRVKHSQSYRQDLTVATTCVGFDINCGVRLLRTNLTEEEVTPLKGELCQSLFNHIPVGVGSEGVIPTSPSSLQQALEEGIDWSVRQGYAWAEDKEHCEEFGRMLQADPAAVSQRAKKRGTPQLGTLGAGNHYAEIQVVDEIYNKHAATKMGLERKGQVCVMIHSGSRGLGHQVATDALVQMEKAMARDGISTNDRQLACARIGSDEGQHYLKAMAAAANYAWVNRSTMTFLCRQAFAKQFDTTPDDLEMAVVYDVSHNIAKLEEHMVDGRPRTLLVHRKGATRAFPPHHPLIPVDYQARRDRLHPSPLAHFTGQPVLIGGTMGTCSYVLTGTEWGMAHTWGSTCHGAGRAKSRAGSRRQMDYSEVLEALNEKGIAIRVASPKLLMEEAPDSYKDVSQAKIGLISLRGTPD